MRYGKKIYDKAKSILNERRLNAENLAQKKHDDVCENHPEILLLEEEMAQTGISAVKAIGMGSDAESYIKKLARENLAAQEKRSNILKSMGLPEDYLNVNYSCPLCEDKGFYDGKMCDCHKLILRQLAYKELSSKSPLDKSTFEQFKLKYYSDEPDPKFGVVPRKQMENILNYCKDYSDNFSINSCGLFMHGNTGLGKTHLSLAIAGAVINKGFGVIYGSAQNLLTKLENEKFGKASVSDISAEEALLDCDLLIIDDLGAEFSTQFTISAVYNLINTRISENKPVIINTNLSPKELEEKYSQRITSRIIGTYTSLFFCGKDIRQQKLYE